MNRWPLLFCAVALGLLLAALLALHHRLGETRAAVAAQRARHASLQRELSTAQEKHHAVRRDLVAAESQLAQLTPTIATPPPPPPPPSPSNQSSADPLLADWLARTRQLRDLVEKHPAHAIPELQLLSADDWLRVAREAAFDTDEHRRQALAALRHAAKLRLVPILAPAAQKFTVANLTGIPSHPSELSPYFTSPVATDILARWEIHTPAPSTSRQSRWTIREKAPVDEDHDQRLRIDFNGSHGTQSGPLAWHDDYAARLQHAYQSYVAAHPDTKRPPTLVQVTPFIQPPLPPATLEKLLERERAADPLR